MAVRKIKWSSLLRCSDLEFEPEPPIELVVSDELVQSLSWLTGATRQDRRLLRCTEDGALLVANAWDGLNSAEVDELYPQNGTPDVYTAAAEHKAVLIATSTQIVKLSIVRKSGETALHYYVPPNQYFFYPHSVYTITATVVPASGGTANYVGITALI